MVGNGRIHENFPEKTTIWSGLEGMARENDRKWSNSCEIHCKNDDLERFGDNCPDKWLEMVDFI